ncbi:MAG TPA: prepilin-type N-terminal cleavage/methylation domain-containing protein [Dehalococcoidia bacterium]|nr:prepilin-type N-terminal cleavage/methylation domain-containing protein [Dehalococcoidia bacterium]
MKNQAGFAMLEVLVSLALIGIVVAGILSALATSSRATITNDVQTTAQNLAEGQIEFIRSQPYDDDIDNDPPQYLLLADIPGGYSVSYDAVRLDLEGDGPGDDDGLQKITVSVVYHNITATKIEAYRAK